MADSLLLSGSIVTNPSVGNPSGFPSVSIPLDERMVLENMQPSRYVLSADAPVSVAFGGVVNANFVVIKVEGGLKVRARVTSTDGATQAIPVDDLLILKARSVPITAIDLTRVAGVATNVEVYLGDQA